ncbi:MAG: hypothetical protein ACI9JY_000654 [Saprospiraceae bacterium]|jgi:hypothetical protein
MKKFAFSLLVLCFMATTSFAQKSADATATTAKLTPMYTLTDVQVSQMQVIQERKYRNLSEIEGLKSTDREKYILKLRSIQTGNDASIKKMLTENQRIIFDQKKVENRTTMAVQYKQMKGDNLSKEQTDDKIIALEMEKLDNH